MSRLRLLLGFAVVLTATSVASSAQAQTITGATANPERITSSGEATVRAANLNPLGISYSDCTADMTLKFAVTLQGFPGTASVEVWASLGSYCVELADRGIGSTSPACWAVSPAIVDPTINAPASTPISVRVQDLVGWQSALPTPAQASSPPRKGAEACSAQTGIAAVPMLINFLAVDGQGNAVGVPYVYQINTDLVGPPAPAGVCETVGDTLFNLAWTANTDSDTIGYAVYVDPIPGQEPAGAGIDAGVGIMAADAGGCANANSNASCNDPILASAIVVASVPDGGTDSGAESGTTQPGDDASNGTEGGVVEGPGGISTVPPSYIYKATGGLTVDKATNQYTINGLVDYVPYTVAVAAVDGTGNTGPPSAEVCDYPAPIQDFWQVYESDGGGKGGFCALETVGIGGPSLAGVACVLVVVGVVRRRRRRGEAV